MRQKPNTKLRDLLKSTKAKTRKLSELSKTETNRLAKLNAEEGSYVQKLFYIHTQKILQIQAVRYRLRHTDMGRFQGISPRQAEFAAFGGYKGVGIPAISKGLDSMYRGAMEPF